MKDTLQRFLFEQANVRGELVQLEESWRAVLERHDYPEPVRQMLGEALVAATLLAATMKFSGSITLQVRGDGPISLLVADCSPDFQPGEDQPAYQIRGMASWQGEVPKGDLASRFGTGHLVITIDPGKGGKRYQGVVALAGESLAEAIDDYLERSEQLPTRMWLAVAGEQAAGMLLQRLPGGDSEEEDWQRLSALAGTITGQELLALPGEQLLHRLFHEEDRRQFAPQQVSFSCHCSRERIAAALRGMGREEVKDMLAEKGKIEASCQFCNQHYHFDVVDVEQIFAAEISPQGSDRRH